jgi:hypothetical protein
MLMYDPRPEKEYHMAYVPQVELFQPNKGQLG